MGANRTAETSQVSSVALATPQIDSSTALPTIRTTVIDSASFQSTLPLSALSSLVTATGCEVSLPEITAYIWKTVQPNVTLSRQVNAAGIQIAGIDLTTGGSDRDGQWIHETTRTTL